VVNGFVTCDFQLGCYCCKFCLNRRYPDWNELLKQNRIIRNPLGIPQAARLLFKVKAFTQAKATLKIGHDTDMSLEEEQAQELYTLVPADHPVVWMRRGKLLPAYRDFYMKERRNLLVKVTLTPRSGFLEVDRDPFEVLNSFGGVRCAMVYFVGPVCRDNLDEAREIVAALPAGAPVWVKELIVKDSPYFKASADPVTARVEELRRFAAESGHPVADYLNCLVRAEVGLPFHKRGEFVSEPNEWELLKCRNCRTLSACDVRLTETQERKRIRAALDDIGVTEYQRPEKFGYKSFRVIVKEDVNFGDECYVREKACLKVDLCSPGRKTGTSLTASIVDRWRRKDFFPVDELMDLARESYRIAFGGASAPPPRP
jgi:hypothetical protein